MKKILKQILPSFLPIALAVTLLCGLFYVAIQQVYRMSANDPQIQIAEDIAQQLANGAPPGYYVPNVKIDISKSLGTFIVVYDKNGKLVESSATLNGKTPQIPKTALLSAGKTGESRITWQPQTGTRLALIIVHYKSTNEGYIAIGRSLREVEKRTDGLTEIVSLGWVVTLFLVFSLMYLQKRIS